MDRTDRAVVAISEDRQWLVTMEPQSKWTPSEPPRFSVLEWRGVEWRLIRWVEDTGQDAHEVLAAFLREREE